ncbi:ATP-dependent protease La [Circinella umbellata]|nr:ATP-dependent protease La [Circinella umbellata]
MNNSFLVHISKKITRSQLNNALASQLQTRSSTTARSFSTASTRPAVTMLASEPVLQSLHPTRGTSVFVALQPIRSAAAVKRHMSTMQLREQDPANSDPAGNGGVGGGAAGGNGNGENNNGNGDGNGGDDKSSRRAYNNVIDNQLQKPTVPEVYPQVLAVPIARRPLFPGFYKAIVIKDPNVTSAIKDLLKRGQPYVGAFLLKDDTIDVDTITNLDQVHKVGVFAQITSVFPVNSKNKDEGDGGLTAVLYPHRRIEITDLINTTGKPAQAAVEEVKSVENQELAVKESEPASEAAKQEPVTEVAQESAAEELNAAEGGDKETQYATSFLANEHAVSLVNVENLVDPPYDKKDPMIRAITSEIVSVFKEIATLNPLFRDQIASFSMSQSAGNVFEEPAKLADFAAAVSTGEPLELQEVMETLTVEDRLQKALTVLKKELMNAQLQNKISKDVESKIAKRQREYYLMEQLKGIKKELGLESDGKEKLVEGFKEKANKLVMPEAVRKVFDEEVNKLAHLEPAASEFNVTRNYLDWLTQVPWGQRSRENYNITHAKTVLDEDHYGLQDVKERILEFIAVGKLRGTVEGKILCLSGPPGTGKTSIGKSIARALDREFYRFSVGGLTDVAEIKGHRRTYVGAMPGKVIQALKKVKTENPLILIDEIDKIGRGHQGDPSSALLELLDPEQNGSFLDHYMDVPVDLSKVLFVCTANVLDTIPGPLLDRMEVIQLSGYIAEEKAAIASKYLAPSARIASGLDNVNVNLSSDAVDTLIRNYCRESGVRNLKKHIDKIFRKAGYQVVEKVAALQGDEIVQEKEPKKEAEDNKESTTTTEQKENSEGEAKEEHKAMTVPEDLKIDITAENLKDYVGAPVFQSDRIYENTPPGVIMGLAWTSMGGSSLYIESVLESSLTPKSQPHLSKTGQLGDVMKESTSIAYTFAKSLMATRFPKNKFFEKARVHLHCPAGATPKDGPSAGVTMVTSMVSLALNKPVSSNIAMTGEITVTGRVLKIGGLKEKTIAAKRSKIDTILFPKDNLSDWEELPDHIKEGMTGVPVEYYEDVYKVCFPDVSKEIAENVWADVLKEEESTSSSSSSSS